MLQAIGRTYINKAEHYNASTSFAPLGWFHGAKQNFNLVSDTVSTLRAALELKAVFERLQQAEQSQLPPDQIRKLEEQAAEQGLKTIWKGAKLEVESVVREVCDKVLYDVSVPQGKRDLRAVALQMMGEVSAAVPAAAAQIDNPRQKSGLHFYSKGRRDVKHGAAGGWSQLLAVRGRRQDATICDLWVPFAAHAQVIHLIMAFAQTNGTSRPTQKAPTQDKSPLPQTRCDDRLTIDFPSNDDARPNVVARASLVSFPRAGTLETPSSPYHMRPPE